MEVHKDIATVTHDEQSHDIGIDAQIGHLANQEDHEMTRWEAIKSNPWVFGWCLFAVWTTLLVSFENQASGIVIGIPQFRQDFGTYYKGQYVLPAKWQSAFSGAPVAAWVHFSFRKSTKETDQTLQNCHRSALSRPSR